MRDCPKCGFRAAAAALECPACGLIYARWRPRENVPLHASPQPLLDSSSSEDGRIGPEEWRILAIGLASAIVVYAIPFTRFVMSALVTLFHELGHAIAGWLMGHVSLPAFDLVYGGGLTHYGQFRVSLVLLIAAGFAWLGWRLRHHPRPLVLISGMAVIWLVLVSAEWRRELFMASAGHIFEFVLAGVLFYQALSGRGWKNPEIERPLGAFAAFFVQIHSMLFAWRLIDDRDFLAWYRQGKGGALMNDLESVALDLTIRFGLQPGIEGVARLLIVFSLVPIPFAIVWHVRRSRGHALLTG